MLARKHWLFNIISFESDLPLCVVPWPFMWGGIPLLHFVVMMKLAVCCPATALCLIVSPY